MSMPQPTAKAKKAKAAPAGHAATAPLKARASGAVARFLGGVLAGPERPTALGIIAAVIGLSLAGFGLLHPAVREATTVPDGVVALVNGEPVLMSDYVSETETAFATPFDMLSPKEKAKGLRDMIDQELMVQRALALDLPEQDTNVRSALGDSVAALVTASAAGAQPTDAQLQAYFNAHKAAYATHGSMAVTDLLIKVGGYENVAQSVEQGLADAQQAVYELRSGGMVDYVKQHYGMVETGKAATEEPDFAARIHLGDRLYDVVQGLSDGQVSDPVIEQDGVHVVIMQHRTAPVFYDFNSVRNNVYSDYQSARKAEAKTDNLTFLRKGAKIIIAPGYSE